MVYRFLGLIFLKMYGRENKTLGRFYSIN